MSGCEQTSEAAAYVLGALDGEEAERFAEHLLDCAYCGREVAELQATVDALPAAVPRLQAPATLSERVMATVRAEAELLAAAGPEADRSRPRRARGRTRWLAFLAAAAAPVAAGVVVGLIVAGSGGSTAAPTRVISAQVSIGGPTARAQVRLLPGATELVVSHLPAPPAGKIYEIWLARGSASPTPTGTLFSVTRAGSGSVAVAGALHGAQLLMVTAEPLGGSSHPTSTPIIVANLRAT